ncbi:hypothetical protein [Amnibacterium kyonggiense]
MVNEFPCVLLLVQTAARDAAGCSSLAGIDPASACAATMDVCGAPNAWDAWGGTAINTMVPTSSTIHPPRRRRAVSLDSDLIGRNVTDRPERLGPDTPDHGGHALKS